MNNDNVKIMLVGTNPLIRLSFKMLLERTEGFKVISEASSAFETLLMINTKKPDVVILDVLHAGDINCIDLVSRIKSNFPDVHTLVLTMQHDYSETRHIINAGAQGFMMLVKAPNDIVDAVKAIVNGYLYFGDVVFERNPQEKNIRTVPVY